MPHILEMPDFTIKAGASEVDFLAAHEKLNREFMKKQKGYISHCLIRDGDRWFDIAVWESAETKEKAFKDIYENIAALEYIPLIEQIQTDDEIPIYIVVKTY